MGVRRLSGPRLFLSHSSIDKEFVRWLGEHLTAAGAKVWIDESEIKIGDSLIEKISSGVNDADFLLAILSPTSVQSEWVQRELNIAITQEIQNRRVKVLPIRIGECTPPAFLLDKKYVDFGVAQSPSLDALRSLLDDLGLDGRGEDYMFFRRFVAFDRYNLNSASDRFDVDVISHFRPQEMETILRRLWFFGVKVHGMDIAAQWDDGSWGIVGADWPKSDKLEDWIEFVRSERLSDCALSLSYTVPPHLLKLFGQAADHEDA